MVIKNNNKFGIFCDWVIVYSLSASIFVLPASIGLLNSFAALAILFYLAKKIEGIAVQWPSAPSNFLGKIQFTWKGFSPPANFLNRPLVFLVLAFFVSVLCSQYPSLSFKAFIGKFLKCLFLYFSFIEVFISEERIWIFIRFFLLAAFVMTLDGLYQYHWGVDFIHGRHIGIENFISTHRVSASFYGANGFGAYLLPCIAVVTSLIFTAIVRYQSWTLGVGLCLFLGLLLSCLCWTYSRSSWIGYLVVLFIMTFMDRRKVILAGALLLVFIFIFLPSLSHVRHLYLMNDNNHAKSSVGIQDILEEGGSGRSVYWVKALSIVRSYPVFGAGPNTYTKILERDINAKGLWYAHNCYLQLSAETGLVGLGCFLWVIGVLLWHGLGSCKRIKDSFQSALLQGCVAGLFGFFVQSFFDNTFFTVQLSMMMWMLFGLMVALTRLKG